MRNVDALNARFAAAPGVVARAYDSFQLPPSSVEWVSDGSIGGVVSATLLNRRAPFVYAGDEWHTAERPEWGQMGVILSSSAVHASLRCAYAQDARSRGVKCRGPRRAECSPGCVGLQTTPAHGVAPFQQGWCSSGAVNQTSHQTTCAWRPELLEDMLATQEARTRSLRGSSRCAARCCAYPACPLYNELVLAASSLAALPTTDLLDAVYFLEADAAATHLSNRSAEAAESAARALHSRLERRVAIVAMDPSRQPPFRAVEGLDDRASKRSAVSAEPQASPAMSPPTQPTRPTAPTVMVHRGCLNARTCSAAAATGPLENPPPAQSPEPRGAVGRSATCAAFARGGLFARALECAPFREHAIQTGDDRRCWNLARVQLALQGHFAPALAECVRGEAAGPGAAARRPVTFLRHDLPLAPFCFNVGLLLRPDRPHAAHDAASTAAAPAGASVGCAYPWDAEGGADDAAACDANQTARLATARAAHHRRTCRSGRRAARPRCCFGSVELAVAQQAAFAALQRGARESGACSSGGGAGGGAGGGGTAKQAECCRRWTDSAWEHNEIELRWRREEVAGVYYVREQEESIARVVVELLANSSGHGQPGGSGEPLELVRICDGAVPQRVLDGSRITGRRR